MSEITKAIASSALHLSKVYGEGPTKVVALNKVSVDFYACEFTAIMGPSGSGKSTLMHILAALDTPTLGSAFLGGEKLSAKSDKELTILRRSQAGFIFQSFNLLPMFSAKDNVELPIMLAGQKPDKEWLARIYKTLDIEKRLDHKPSELSGGQQQRVAIARALSTKPAVIFADEPTGNLDSRSGIEVLSLLRNSVRELGQTVIMVTHDPVAASYADRVVLLSDGKIAGNIDNPTPDSVLAGLDALRVNAEVI